MKLISVLAFGLCFMAQNSMAMSAVLNTNGSRMRGQGTSTAVAMPVDRLQYGKDGCRCVGIDNMKGYFATQVEMHHIQYPADAGASCGTWENGIHPQCQETPPPGWCTQRWCYVDPCSCNLEESPKASVAGSSFRGQPAYYSYATCGFQDMFTGSNEDSCVNQKSAESCGARAECAWDGAECGSKDVVGSCSKTEVATSGAEYGEEDCRCVGLHGRDVGHAFMYINDKDMVRYSANVGSSCHAWEMDAHPECKGDGAKPSWCSAKWCFVDPCKCKTKTPPRTMMNANQFMTYQGKVAFWSYDTCGNEDTWSSAHASEYCVTQTKEADCKRMKKCSWNGKECLGKALVEVCEAQERTGVLGYDEVFTEESGACGLKPVLAAVVAIVAAFQ